MYSNQISQILNRLELDPATSKTLTPSTPSISFQPEKLEAIVPSANSNQDLASLPGNSGLSERASSAFLPHECIPPEIWAEIFSIVVDELPICYPPDFLGPHWVLSRTCSLWRSIAFKESWFWNSIEVTLTSMFSAAKIVAFVNRMIFPSGPLSISVTDIASGDVPSFSAEVVGTLVIPHLPRTRALTLYLKSDGYLRLFHAPPELFKSLEVLDLEFGFCVVEESIIDAFRTTAIFNRAQALRKLKLICEFDTPAVAQLTSHVTTTPIPWHQLMVLDLGLTSLNLDTVYCLLRRCSNLQAFNGEMLDSFTPDALTRELIVLPHLQSLTIRFEYGYPSIFNHLTLPTLTELHVVGTWAVPSLYAAIINMLSRSQCPLAFFDVNGPDPDAPSANMVMKHTPAARVFQTHGLLVDNSTLEMIGRGQLLPSLTTLSCHVSGPSAFLGALMLRLRLVEEGNLEVKTLRFAEVYCKRGHWTEPDMSSVAIALNELNVTYGTFYSLDWEP